MGDSEKEVISSKESLEDITVEEMAVRTAKPAKKRKSKKDKKGFLSGVAAEFKKIIWPSRNSLFKQTTAVVVTSVILGAIIALLDWIIKFGLYKFNL
ncbi:MAG: preprotein translocase subunit SecE [Butyrivibrio sp.]